MSGVRGTNQLGRVARAARLADANMPKSIKRKLARMGPKAKKVVQSTALATLPARNGLAALVANSMKVSVKSDTGLTSAGVTLEYTAKGKGENRDIPAMNAGIVRHPVHGRRTVWVAQRVRPGFWDKAAETTAGEAHSHVRDVLDETVKILKNG
jgi:hypothetical protein